jgi:hypothetical protein
MMHTKAGEEIYLEHVGEEKDLGVQVLSSKKILSSTNTSVLG